MEKLPPINNHDNELSRCIETNKPNFFELAAMDALSRKYDLSKAESFVLIRKFYGFDNVVLASIFTQLFKGQQTKDLDLLDEMVTRYKKINGDAIPEFIEKIKNQKL